jgi:hypothetical protein
MNCKATTPRRSAGKEIMKTMNKLRQELCKGFEAFDVDCSKSELAKMRATNREARKYIAVIRRDLKAEESGIATAAQKRRIRQAFK